MWIASQPPPLPPAVRTSLVPQLFLQLAGVKRVGCVSAMCSPADKKTLQDVSHHIRRHCYRADNTNNGGGCDDNNDGDGVCGAPCNHQTSAGDDDDDDAAAGVVVVGRQRAELDAAVCTLGL